MNISRFFLIGFTFMLTAGLMIIFYKWSEPFKQMFSYNGDILSYIMIFLLVISITGIFKWLLKWEIRATRPKRRKRK